MKEEKLQIKQNTKKEKTMQLHEKCTPIHDTTKMNGQMTEDHISLSAFPSWAYLSPIS